MNEALQNAKELIVYEIFVQGFKDTDGDGIGNLRGVIEKVDHIRDVGFNAVWLGPIWDSPWDDGGYDVRDYYMVAPRYGTMADLRELIDALHRRDMKLILDLVPGHTSHQHQWFQASQQLTENEFSGRYIWTPNVWETEDEPEHNYIKGFTHRDGNFMTNFFYCQPALNYGFGEVKYPWEQGTDSPDAVATKHALMDLIRFYFDIGADGLRVDMAYSLVKRDAGNKATAALWQEIRAMLDKEYPGRVLISEWSIPEEAIPAGFHIDMLLHFNNYIGSKLIRYETWAEQGDHGPDKHSYFRAEGKGDFSEFLDPFLQLREKTLDKGFMCIPLDNHDVPRASLKRTPQELKVLYAFLLTFAHVPMFYYGDEIGLEYIEGAPDIEGGYNRTGARNCMHWDGGKNGGFSTADHPYMPMGDPTSNNVELQQKDPNSLLHFLKKAIDLHKSSPAFLADAELSFVDTGKQKYPLIYRRSAGDESFLVVINPKDEQFSVDVGGSVRETLLADGVTVNGTVATIAPVSYGVFRE